MSKGFTQAEKKALMELPGFKEIKKQYSQAGMGKRMKGKGFWDDLWNGIKSVAKDVDSWLTRTKALSTAGKVIGAITAVIPGLQEVAPVALAAAKAGEAMGYGKKKKKTMKGGNSITANNLAQHVNPVAGTKGLVSQGMGLIIKPSDILSMYNPFMGKAAKTMGYGTMAQDYQSPSFRMIGGTYPSHLQPFLTTRLTGMGVDQALGSIGNPVTIKF